MLEDSTDGIVQILGNNDFVVGTGFLVSKNLIATCAHVIKAVEAGPGNKVMVRFLRNGERSNTIVVLGRWYSPDEEDLFLLQLEDELPSDVKVLSLGSSAGVTSHKVYTVGFPPSIRDINGIWAQGEVLGKVTEKGNSLLQIELNQITVGFGGAPLWNESRDYVNRNHFSHL
jgi:S1-C subfamily serine protease